MLEVGRGGMPTDAYIVHFSMWALTKSPLILGHNLARMDAGTLAIVSNKVRAPAGSCLELSLSRRVRGADAPHRLPPPPPKRPGPD